MRAPRPTVAFLGVLALAGAAVAVASQAELPALSSPQASVVPLDRATLVCPSATTGSSREDTITVTSLGSGEGTVRVERLGALDGSQPLAQRPAAADGPTVLRYTVPAGRPQPFVVRATGAMAQGLTATVSSRTSGGTGRGRTTALCTAPGATSWFVGGAATSGRRDVLYLTNVDATAAVVDLAVYTPDGPQQPSGATGIVVGPGRQTRVALDALVPGAKALGLVVRSVTGRAAAALFDGAVDGLKAAGSDWVPPSAAPKRRAVVPAVAGHPQARRVLQVLVPGADDAVVRLHVVSAEGSIAPVGLDTLEVPAGQVVQFPLSGVKATGPYALSLDSDRPVLASVRVVRSGSLSDFTYATSAAALRGSVVLPDAQSAGATSTALMLTAPGAAGQDFTVTTYGRRSRDQVVRVPAGTTQTVLVGSGAQAAVVVTPADPATAWWGGWVLTENGSRGPLVTGLPLVSGPSSVLVPGTVADPAAGYPGR